MSRISVDFERLPKLIKRFHIKRKELAEEMCCAPQCVSAWFTGNRKPSRNSSMRAVLAAKRLIKAKLAKEIDHLEARLDELRTTLRCIEEEEDGNGI
jgi:predicted transcriptional regulator